MPEQLITQRDAADRIKVSIRTWRYIRPELVAKGMKLVKAGNRIMILESSLDRLIQRCAEREERLYTAPGRKSREPKKAAAD